MSATAHLRVLLAILALLAAIGWAAPPWFGL